MAEQQNPKVLLIPSSGMGHLIPMIRLAFALSARNITVTLLAARPTVSFAETRLLSSLPPSFLHDLSLPPLDPSLFPPSSDPFFLRMESLRRSARNLSPLLSSFSALIVDIFAASTFIPAANVPCFILSTSSAAMLALCAAFPSNCSSPDAEIAGVAKIPPFALPQPLRDPNHIFTTLFVESGRALALADGILANTFAALEPEMIAALKSGKVAPDLPPVYDVGPLPWLEKQQSLRSSSAVLNWLDAQKERSVMYVSFGSRTAMSRAQMRELGDGLEMSGWPFLWVVKRAKVDREEEEEKKEAVEEGRGLVVSEWVDQGEILGHRAVGGFLSHCGWNSVMEAAAVGVKVLAWPRMGDQRVNAGVVKGGGVGVWVEEWVWEGEEGVLGAEEIGRKVREVMENERVGRMAAEAAAKAAAAVAEGGSSDGSMRMFVERIMK